MPSYLRWAFRPTVLILVSVLLVAAAMVVVLPVERGTGRPMPLPVQEGEREIAWLYPATSTTTWERFASAVQQARDRLEEQFPGLEWENNSDGAAPALATPQIALHWPEGERREPSRLVFRWYKLTSQWTPRAWIEALMARDPPPLAIIGGNNSYWARELAVCLAGATQDHPPASRPLLLLTTATADRVGGLDDEVSDSPALVPLTSIYPARTFCFCFTNRQMATAVTRFIWGRPELQPDGDPAYLVRWMDDAYSRDFFAGSMVALDYRATDTLMQQWGFVTGAIGLRLPPAALAGWYTSGFRHEATVQLDVDSSVGSFAAPNPYEAKVVRDLLAEMRTEQRRPLLVLTGQQQPSRRFLRDLARSAPDAARRFVVAMGDAVSFNTIYRDRQVTWPIQDLPFTLVFFAHRNPIDTEAGFRRAAEGVPSARTRASGTEDVLLFRDVVEASALAFRGGERPGLDAEGLAAGLGLVRWAGDRLTVATGALPLFGRAGQRSTGTGEHVVYLSPHFDKQRVLPRGTIEVWARRGTRAWRPVGSPLTISFNEFEVHHGDRPQ